MFTSVRTICAASGAVLAGLVLAGGANADGGYGGPYTFGTPATQAEIAAWDIDIMADGRGLPRGQGTYEQGKTIYANQCAFCHGENLQGGNAKAVELEPPLRIGPRLIGGRGTLNTEKPVMTVESYWPYSSTLFDFIRRAMPMPSPGSLTDEDIYALSAYILAEANITDKSEVMNADTLWRVKMPNRDGFYPDDRPDPVVRFD